MKIGYVTSKNKLLPWLEHSWDNSYNLSPFKSGSDLRQFAAICLVEPFEARISTDAEEKRGVFLCLFPVWKRYLEREAPEVKLLLLRYTEQTHPNIVPLLDLREDFDWEHAIDNARPNTESWEKDVDLVGTTSVLDKLQLFFQGHNSQGFVDVVARVRQKLNHVYHELYRLEDTPWRTLWKEQVHGSLEDMRLLHHRWRNYEVYFRAMPFWNMLEEFQIQYFLKDLVETCSQAYDDATRQELKGNFMKLNAYERLDQIQTKLNYLNKKFITPDELGKVLIIDDDLEYHDMLTVTFPSYRFFSAYTEAEGQAKIEALQDELSFVILDMRLQEESTGEEGLRILEWSKASYPDLPIIVISTSDDAHLQLKTIKLGAAYFLNKSSFSISNWNSIFLRCFAESDQGTPAASSRILNGNKNSASKLKILLIDDHRKWAKETARVLGEFNFALAYTPQQARDKLTESADHIALVMADIILDDESDDVEEGLNLLRFIKANYPKIPLVAISRRSEQQLIISALEAGAIDFLRKDHFNGVIWKKRIENYARLRESKEQETPAPILEVTTP